MPRRSRLQMVSLEDRTAPAVFTVTNTLDSGPGSLRHAVDAANKLPGADVVIFQIAPTSPTPMLPQVNLTSGEIAITDSVSIIGGGPSSTNTANLMPVAISGNQSSRIFNINGPGVLSVNLRGLVLHSAKSNNAGGAILNVGENLSISGCTFFGNMSAGNGGAIGVVAAPTNTPSNQAGPFVTISGSRFLGNHAVNGGAIQFTGPAVLNVVETTFDKNNAAERGGAIAFGNGGHFTIDRTTLSHNIAGIEGGAMHFVALQSGPVIAPSSGLLLRNSTVSGNIAKLAGGGVALTAFNSGVFTIANSTVTRNGAGLNQTGTISGTGGGLHVLPSSASTSVGQVSVISSVLSGNFAAFGPDAATPGKLSASFSAIGSAAGIGTFVGSNTNLPLGADLKLAPLANNGGPTFTHMPASNSPLINKGSNPFMLQTDQRGGKFSRVLGPQADIGAVERPVPVVAPIAPIAPIAPPTPAPFNSQDDANRFFLL